MYNYSNIYIYIFLERCNKWESSICLLNFATFVYGCRLQTLRCQSIYDVRLDERICYSTRVSIKLYKVLCPNLVACYAHHRAAPELIP